MREYTMTELRAMTDQELLELSRQKNSRGRYSANADRAMKVRRERSGHWDGVKAKPPGFEHQEILYRGDGNFTKKFKEARHD